MAIIATASINLSKIDKSKIIDGRKGKYLSVSIMLNDEESEWGDNVSLSIGQSKEEREAKEPKTYIGNGKVVWDNGQMPCKPEYKGGNQTRVEPDNDELEPPF